MPSEPTSSPESEELAAASDDDREADLLAEIGTLPRVASVEVRARTTHVDPPKDVRGPKANIELTLKPFSPRSKRQMVTMSDMAMNGRPRGGVAPGRGVRKPD